MPFGAQVLLSSHLGRPKDGPEDKFSLNPVAERLASLLGKKVTMAPDCIGEKVSRYGYPGAKTYVWMYHTNGGVTLASSFVGVVACRAVVVRAKKIVCVALLFSHGVCLER